MRLGSDRDSRTHKMESLQQDSKLHQPGQVDSVMRLVKMVLLLYPVYAQVVWVQFEEDVTLPIMY
jgi:hypothetical protein